MEKNHRWCMVHDKIYREAYIEWIKDNPPLPPVPRHSKRARNA